MHLFVRRPAFTRLWLAGSVSLLGDWLSFVAVSVLALGGRGGPIDLAIVHAAHALPGALVAPFAGVVVDRFDRRRVLVVADGLATVLTVAMALAAHVGRIEYLEAFLVVRSAATALVPPAESASVRRVVDASELRAANTILALTWSTTYVVGMALGGIASSLGPSLALVLDAGTFAIAALVHATLPSMPVERDDVAQDDGVFAAIRATPRDTTAALRGATRDRQLFSALLAKAPFALASGAAWVAVTTLVFTGVRAREAAFVVGVLQALRGAGTGIGPAVTTRLTARGLSEASAEHVARGTLVLALAALALVTDRAALAAIALGWGMATGTNWVLSHTRLQSRASEQTLGRLAAFDELLVATSTTAGAFLGALVTEAANPHLAALASVALALVAWTATRHAVRALARDTPSQAPRLAHEHA